MTLPRLPSFYEKGNAEKVYLERAADVAAAAYEARRQYGIKPAGEDKFKIALFAIDVQNGFCVPGASLFVPGAVQDTQRTIEWLYKNLDVITGLHFSLDTHRVFQIFHPAWWMNDRGENPAPFSTITYDDLKAGKWRAISNPRESLEYVRQLEASGKYVLTIWPYHTLLGGVSHALVPAFMEAAIFHAVARQRQTHFETKGTHALTENYSVLSPEVTAIGGNVVGQFNTAFFKMLMDYDRVYVAGQAKSHCVLTTLEDMQKHIEKNDRSLMDKIYILEDATSPVPPPPLNPLPPTLDFPRVADEKFKQFKAAGMHIVKTTDPVSV
jgi:nicotinamidase-related amidase